MRRRSDAADELPKTTMEHIRNDKRIKWQAKQHGLRIAVDEAHCGRLIV